MGKKKLVNKEEEIPLTNILIQLHHPNMHMRYTNHPTLWLDCWLKISWLFPANFVSTTTFSLYSDPVCRNAHGTKNL